MLEPVRIEPESFYDGAAIYQALGLTAGTLAAGRRSGLLRFSRRGNRVIYKGAWLLAWLESNETDPVPAIGQPGVERGLAL